MKKEIKEAEKKANINDERMLNCAIDRNTCNDRRS